jgi:sugar transferase (PEP-CTERM/EpsH1 system associated)
LVDFDGREAMKEILFLAHRIPYPPNKGDKIRSFNLLKYLSRSYRVYLGAFVDDPRDWRYVSDVEQYCAETRLLPLHRVRGKLRSLRGLLAGEPLTVPYCRDRHMAAWVDAVMGRRDIHSVLVFSSGMAQYVEKHGSVPRIIDFVDVDSDKWRQYAEKKAWPANWIYRREADRLFRFDRRIANSFDRSLFVSEHEAALFGQLAPETAGRVLAVRNGVDTVFFSGSEDYPNPYPLGARVMVFTGAMDYWANVDAVQWFADEAFPGIRRCLPAARFFVVGARPTEAVRALGRREGITVVGAVKDIRPYLRHAHAAVAPLRIARGIQNKVLEAMAMGKPVLASPAAMEGIEAETSLDVLVADQAADWADAALRMLRDGNPPLWSEKNRRFVEQRYGWDNSLSRLGTLLESL